MTDLPDIVPNLQKNIERNYELIKSLNGLTSAQPLDWSDEQYLPGQRSEQYPVILAADPLYSPEHPQILTETVDRWLRRTPDARFVVELPLREGYSQERAELRSRLEGIDLTIEEEGEDTAYDDWGSMANEFAEVTCWWAVWKPKSSPSSLDAAPSA